MRKFVFYAVALVFFVAAALYTPQEASAAPTFARQTGMACNSCHFQHFPTLNAFGRAFKAGGYTQVGGQSLIEGDMLSLPATLNASLITKIRYQKTNGDAEASQPTNKGEVQFPDEAALLIGGRAGEHIGFLLEASLKDGDSRFTSFKVPITYNLISTDISVIPFSTDAAGAAYAYELLNTGALRMQRPIEHRAEMSAAQYLGTDGAATGFAFVLHQPLWYANYTAYAPTHGDHATGPYLTYGRLAVTPTIAGWDFGLGGQIWTGTSKNSDTTRTRNDAWVVDAQAQGMIGSFPVGVYASYGEADKSDTNEIANSLNASTTDKKNAASVLAEFGVLPNRLTLFAGYLYGKGGTLNGNSSAATMEGQNATTVGANYQLAQNFNLQWNTSFYGGASFDPNPTNRGDQLTTVMIFAAF